MAKPTKSVPTQKSQPATGSAPPVALRLPPSLLSEIDTWAERQSIGLSREDAIRRLIEKGLGGARLATRHNTKIAAHASKVASQTIDSIVDKSAPPQEQESRKRRLLKGPQEFRDMRSDLAKPKK